MAWPVVKGLLSCAKNPVSLQIYDSYSTDILTCSSILLERAKGLEHFSIQDCVILRGQRRIFINFLVCLILKAQNLKYLSIEQMVTEDVGRTAISKLYEVLPLLPNLTTLILRNVDVTEYEYVYQSLSKLVHLSSLSLTWWSWPNAGQEDYQLAFVKFLFFLQSCPLIHLEIDINRVTDQSLGLFSRFHQLQSLQFVNSSDLGPQGIEAIGTIDNLTYLYIGCVSSQLTDTDLARAFKNGKLKNLTTFGMQYCHIEFQSTNQVALLSAIGKCCGSLRNVCLLNNKWLTVKGVVALANSCPTLRLLEVRGYDDFIKSWDTTSMLSVVVNLEDLIINEELPADVKQSLVKWNRENSFPRIEYCSCKDWEGVCIHREAFFNINYFSSLT